jgi:hypothetical protein
MPTTRSRCLPQIFCVELCHSTAKGSTESDLPRSQPAPPSRRTFGTFGSSPLDLSTTTVTPLHTYTHQTATKCSGFSPVSFVLTHMPGGAVDKPDEALLSHFLDRGFCMSVVTHQSRAAYRSYGTLILSRTRPRPARYKGRNTTSLVCQGPPPRYKFLSCHTLRRTIAPLSSSLVLSAAPNHR